MARSIEEIKNTYTHLSSKEKTQAIRKDAANLWIEYKNQVPFMRDGYEVEKRAFIMSNGRQDECIEYISKVEGYLESNPVESAKPVEPTKLVEATKPVETTKDVESIDESDDYSDSEAEKKAIAEKLYYATNDRDNLTGLREYQFNLCKSQKYFLPEFAILIARARIIIEDFANGKSRTGVAHPGSIQKIRLEVTKYLADIVARESDKFPPVNDRTLNDTFNDFDQSLRGAFGDVGAAKYKLNRSKNEAAEEDVRAIKAYPYLAWAIDLLSNLPPTAAKWKEVAIACMLLTGRRQSEVLSSGIFSYVDDSHVIFEGQLKRHVTELVPPEKIPVLGKAARGVINAIAWLEKFNKRSIPESRDFNSIQKAAKKSHDRCSRYIAETMSELSGLCQIINGKDWVVNEDGKQVNKFKGHLNRQIYAQICSALFNDANESKKRAYISRILLENRDAALSYDRDIEIKDIDAIGELCSVFVDE